jgi:hypothetical protein
LSVVSCQLSVEDKTNVFHLQPTPFSWPLIVRSTSLRRRNQLPDAVQF